MASLNEVFKSALAGKRLPPLTLDNKWHKLFNRAIPNSRIKKAEKELNELLKRQGKLTTEIKRLKKMKTDLMRDIVDEMDEADEREQEEKQRLINEINEKMEEDQDELTELPERMDAVNYSLMLETMGVCYEMLSQNTAEIEEISAWIHDVRVELKKKLIRKQEKEIENIELYTYMNDIFGPEVADIFDLRYDVEESRRELLDRRAALREQEQEKVRKMERFKEALELRKEADEQKRAEQELREAQQDFLAIRRPAKKAGNKNRRPEGI